MSPKITTAQANLQAAQKKLLAAVQAEFPEQSAISWEWNSSHQHGRVVWVNSCWWSSPEIRVTNSKTGKTLNIWLHNHPTRTK